MKPDVYWAASFCGEGAAAEGAAGDSLGCLGEAGHVWAASFSGGAPRQEVPRAIHWGGGALMLWFTRASSSPVNLELLLLVPTLTGIDCVSVRVSQ